MLSSIITSSGSTNIKDEINDFLKENDAKGRGARNTGWLDTDWLMKACLVISDLPVVYKLESFNHANLSTIKSNWEAIKSSISELVKIINGFGIDGSNLTSKMLYYLLSISLPILDSKPAQAKIVIRGTGNRSAHGF